MAKDTRVWLCAAKTRKFFFFPDTGRYLPVQRDSFESFLDDKFFFGRWHPTLASVQNEKECFQVIAKREKSDIEIESKEQWSQLMAQFVNRHMERIKKGILCQDTLALG